MEFNYILFILFLGYIASLVAGFGLHSKNKTKFSKHYIEYKKLLIALIIQIHILSAGLFLYLAKLIEFFYLLSVIELLFIGYVIYLYKFKTRCDLQHFTIIHNFLLIPLIYYSYLIFSHIFLFIILVLILVYNVLMFQFAKYNTKQAFLWD